MEPLSICMVTTFYPPHHFGGDALHAYRLTNALARRGHEVTVVSSDDAYLALGGKAHDEEFPHEPNVVLRPISTGFPRTAALSTYLSGRPLFYGSRLRALFGGQRFDVVHFHNVSLVGGPGVLRYGSGVKLYTTSEHWLVCPMHVLFRDNREPCEEPHCVRCSLAYRRPPQLWRSSDLLQEQVRHVDLFLSPSRFTLEAHRSRGFDAPMRHLPHFLPAGELDRDAAAPAPRLEGRPYFLFVGRLERLKGAHVVIDAFRSYRGADLVIAGEGEEESELRRRAADLDHVHFLGRVAQAELGPLYSGAIALVVPSIGYEVFGLVLLEAFARGTPAIVNDLGALPEVVREAQGGIVYGTQDELVAALERLQTAPAVRDELGASGRDAWRRLWTEERHLDGYFAAVEEARTLAAGPRSSLQGRH